MARRSLTLPHVLPSTSPGSLFSSSKTRLTKKDVGSPVDFNHVQHIGHDPEKGFMVSFFEWETLYKKPQLCFTRLIYNSLSEVRKRGSKCDEIFQTCQHWWSPERRCIENRGLLIHLPWWKRFPDFCNARQSQFLLFFSLYLKRLEEATKIEEVHFRTAWYKQDWRALWCAARASRWFQWFDDGQFDTHLAIECRQGETSHAATAFA